MVRESLSNGLNKQEESMAVEREDWITKRAYQLWQEAGRPEGYHEEHWTRATEEWEAGQTGKTDPGKSWDDDEY